MSSDCEHKVIYDETSGEELCRQCGIIFEANELDQNTFNFRTGDHANYLYASNGTSADFTLQGLLSSKIDERNVDCYGHRIKNSMAIARMRYTNKYLVNPRYNNDKSRRNAMRNIAALCDKLSLPSVIKERAADIYKKAYKANAVRGRSTKNLSTASVFYSCKEAGIIRGANDFVEALHENSKWRNDLFSSYKTLITVLELQHPNVVNPITEIPHVASKAHISDKSVRKSIDIYNKLKNHDGSIFYGKSPTAISVCVLYIATKYNNEIIKQEDITKAGEVSTVTLRKRCEEYIKILADKLDEPLPNFFSANKPHKSKIPAGTEIMLRIEALPTEETKAAQRCENADLRIL